MQSVIRHYEDRWEDWTPSNEQRVSLTENDLAIPHHKIMWGPAGMTGSGRASLPCRSSAQSPCTLEFNPGDAWYNGFGEAGPGYSNTGGVFVHELGHWYGIDDCPAVPRYSPLPHQDMVTMCFDDPSGDINQPTPSQDDLQALNFVHYDRGNGQRRYFQVNGNLKHCGVPPGALTGPTTCEPTYWMVSGADWVWLTNGGGQIRMKPQGETEVTQRAIGHAIDWYNDGLFKIQANMRSNTSGNQVVDLFVRAYNGTSEHRCPVTVTPTWTMHNCQIYLGGAAKSWEEYEYGVRADAGEDVRVNIIRIRHRSTLP